MSRSWPCLIGLALVALASGADDAPVAGLDMSKAVACRKINGFEDFEPLDEPKVTTEDKLLVYYRPLHYVMKEHKEGGYVAHFKQDVKVRKRGEKKVLWVKDNLLDFEARNPTQPVRIYLTNSISVKGFPPGEYDMDIVLRDALKPGTSATQTMRFQVVAPPPLPKDDSAAEPEKREAPPEEKPQGKPTKKARRSPKSAD